MKKYHPTLDWYHLLSNKKYFIILRKVLMATLLFSLIFSGYLLRSSPEKRVFSAGPPYYGYAPAEITGTHWIDLWNYENKTITVSIDVYEADGDHVAGFPKTKTLAPFEEVSINVTVAENLATCGRGAECGLGLASTDDGTPSTDTAYGMIFSSNDAEFGVIGSFDLLGPGFGGSPQTYNLQPELFSDTWWGMYNYPSTDEVKWDYFHIFNANSTPTTVYFDIYDSDGNVIDVVEIPFTAYQTQKLYPRTDLNVPIGEQDIGIHMYTDGNPGVAVHVSTNLGSGYNFDVDEYTTHDAVGGGWIPWPTEYLDEDYYFTNAVDSASLAAVRVTNPNNVATTVTWNLYAYDGSIYTRDVVIPALGTREFLLPVTNTTDSDNLKDETTPKPWYHASSLESSAGPIVAHVSYENNIDTPVKTLFDFYYGVRDSSRLEKQWMMFNPNSYGIDITCETWYFADPTDPVATHDVSIVQGARGGSQPPGTGTDVTLGPFDVLITNPSNTTYGPGFESSKDMVVHCYSEDPWAIELQEPDYGDVTPLRGGYKQPELGTIGTTIWNDKTTPMSTLNGFFDPGEVGIAGVLVELRSPGVDGVFGTADDFIRGTQATNAAGEYLFTGLPDDAYQVRILASNFDPGGALVGYVSTIDPGNPGDGYNKVYPYNLSLAWGEDNIVSDFGFYPNPTAIDVMSFSATTWGDKVTLTWEVVQNAGLYSFNLYRSTEISQARERINDDLIYGLPPGSLEKPIYTYDDVEVSFGTPYFYWLEVTDLQTQEQTLYGPERALWWKYFLPILSSD
jgi:hypothetical protein